MRNPALVFTFAVLCLVGLVLAYAQAPAPAPTVKLAWQMAPATFAFRTATLTAYPVAASDFEVPVRCAYLGDLDTYVWQFKAEVPAKYQTGDWILYGQTAGEAVAFTFTLKDGAVGTLTPAPIPAPTITDTPGAAYATASFTPPGVALQSAITWEVLTNGQPGGGPLDNRPVTETRTYQLRGTLPGAPKQHYITTSAVEITPEPGSHA